MSVFDEAAKTWDLKPERVDTAKRIGEAIVSLLPVSRKWRVLDFGAGTGLLTLYLEPFVSEVVSLDNSKGMVEVLSEKIEKLGIKKVKPVLGSFEDINFEEPFDLIVSSMAVHHVKDLKPLFNWFSSNLKSKGFLAISDLEKEDGTFHSSNDGVYHFGFDREEIFKFMKLSRIEPVDYRVVKVFHRNNKEYPLFLAVGRKP